MRALATLLLLGAATVPSALWAGTVTLDSKETRAGSEPYSKRVDEYLKGVAPKIVNGKEAKISDFPWQVSLGVSWIGNPYEAHFCGGSLYAQKWIVTAAHCVVDTMPKDIVVTVGTDKLTSGAVRLNVATIYVKGDYVKKTQDNDIALLELREPVKVGANIQFIPLLTGDEEKTALVANTNLMVTGWGLTSEGGPTSKSLRYAVVPWIPSNQCNRPLAYDGAITDNMICAGWEAGGTDACQGDSGGPLSLKVGSGSKLAGIVSWGKGCAQPNKVGVYTRVAKYAQWVAACVNDPVTCK